MERTSERRVPEWVFGVLTVPFGVVGQFTSNVMGRMLAKAHVPPDRIAKIIALAILPLTFQYLWAPIVDIGMRRRTWLVVLSGLGASCLLTSLFLPIPSQLGLFVVLVVAGSAFVGLNGSCTGGMMAVSVPKSNLGSAGAWSNIGNLGAGAFGGFGLMQLASSRGPRVVGAALVAMIMIPACVALFVPEPVRARRSAAEVFGGTLRDLWRTVRARSGWTGILLCASPVGTAALSGLFSSVAQDFHATDRMVNFVNGFWSGLLTAGGCYIGGLIADRMNRRLAYVLSALLTAACALAMAAARLTPTTYAVGALFYLFITGFDYAAFTAFVLEIVGDQEGAAASTRYTLFTAAANGAIAYVTAIDGMGYKRWGTRGLLVTDAVANLGGILLLGAVLLPLLRSAPRAADAKPAVSAPPS
jgi:MFS family permease